MTENTATDLCPHWCDFCHIGHDYETITEPHPGLTGHDTFLHRRHFGSFNDFSASNSTGRGDIIGSIGITADEYVHPGCTPHLDHARVVLNLGMVNNAAVGSGEARRLAELLAQVAVEVDIFNASEVDDEPQMAEAYQQQRRQELVEEGCALFDKFVRPVREERKVSLADDLAELLDLLPRLTQAYPIGDDHDKTLHFWTAEDFIDAGLGNHPVLALLEATGAATFGEAISKASPLDYRSIAAASAK